MGHPLTAGNRIHILGPLHYKPKKEVCCMKKVLLVLVGMALVCAATGYAQDEAKPAAPAAPAAVETPQATPATAEKAVTTVYTCDKCHTVAMKAGECPMCKQAMKAMNVLSVNTKDGTAMCCACHAGCKCTMKDDDNSKCSCGKDIAKISLKGKYVCSCGEKCCTTVSDKPGKCACDKDMMLVK
jgi:hypothetical protein